MGSIWLDGRSPAYPALDRVIRDAGLNLTTWDGWQTRSRSSGGFESLLGIVVHHTASSTSWQNDWSYCAVGHPDAPVANLLLGRDGLVGLHAGGASNHAGSGGPRVVSRGTIPQDSANSRTIGIEAQNAGTGEAWSPVMVDAYERLVAALCQAYGLDPRDAFAHYEWTSRKIDPWGGSDPTPGFSYTGPHPWIMDGGGGFTDSVRARMSGGPSPDDDDEVHLASWYAHHA